jgi:hypothetical protein
MPQSGRCWLWQVLWHVLRKRKLVPQEILAHQKLDGKAIGHDAKCHNEQLARCVRALATAPDVASSNPMSLAQMGRFLGKYANWLSKTPSQGVLNAAASLSRLHRSIEQHQLSRTIQILLTKLFRHHLLRQQLLYVIF